MADDYNVENVLGDGRYGFVFKVITKDNRAAFAAKTIDALTNFKKHFQDLESLFLGITHSNITKIESIYMDCRKIYVVKELCTGLPLLGRMVEENAKNPVAVARIAGYMKQLLSAVSYMHDKGCVHGDIKPDGLQFLDKSEEADIKILDISFSQRCKDGECIANSRHDVKMAREYAFQTSPYFTPPETFENKFDNRIDVWSLGAILYTMLSGRPPHHASSDAEVLKNLMETEIEFSHDEWTFISEGLKVILAQMLQKNPCRGRARVRASRATGQQAQKDTWRLPWRHT